MKLFGNKNYLNLFLGGGNSGAYSPGEGGTSHKGGILDGGSTQTLSINFGNNGGHILMEWERRQTDNFTKIGWKNESSPRRNFLKSWFLNHKKFIKFLKWGFCEATGAYSPNFGDMNLMVFFGDYGGWGEEIPSKMKKNKYPFVREFSPPWISTFTWSQDIFRNF